MNTGERSRPEQYEDYILVGLERGPKTGWKDGSALKALIALAEELG